MPSDIVVGLQYGDEGKGKIVNFLAERNEYDYCIRYNGGANAGHTIYVGDKKIVTHQIPSGIIRGIKCIIGDNCYLDPVKLKAEIELLEENNIEVKTKLYISNKCHYISQKHISDDCSNNIIGTTGSGIGYVARDKYFRIGMRVSNNPNLLDFLPQSSIIDVSEFIINHYTHNLAFPRLLIEGAQGFGLDITHGDYPYVTSSHCISTDCLNLGIPLSSIGKIWGIAKIYETYVGSKKFQDENDKILQQLQIVGEEFGSTTGRSRQCNYLNLTNLIKSCWVNNITHLVINKCDILEKVNDFRIYYTNHNNIPLLIRFQSLSEMQIYIRSQIINSVPFVKDVLFSDNPNGI